MKQECKRCLLLESAEGGMLESIKEKTDKLSPDEKCESEVYNERLKNAKVVIISFQVYV